MENCVDIKGFEGRYQVSDLGRIKSLEKRRGMGIQKDKILTLCPDKDKYLLTALYKNKKEFKFKVHRLVAQHFIPNPENKPEVNHKWGDKNDCRAVALEWVTIKENHAHAAKTGLLPKGENHVNSKLTQIQVDDIRIKWKSGQRTQRELAKEYNICFQNVSLIVNNKAWAY